MSELGLFDEKLLVLPQLNEVLDNLHLEHESNWLIGKQEEMETPSDFMHQITKRSGFPKINFKAKKKRACQNMKGILGGSNAFNFMSFVAGVITLVIKKLVKSIWFHGFFLVQVVNVNNNVNNNNNNLNGINGNANNQMNSNANVNNNAANIIIAMPGKKRRRKRTAQDFVNQHFDISRGSRCLAMTSEDEMVNLPFLILDSMKVNYFCNFKKLVKLHNALISLNRHIGTESKRRIQFARKNSFVVSNLNSKTISKSLLCWTSSKMFKITNVLPDLFFFPKKSALDGAIKTVFELHR